MNKKVSAMAPGRSIWNSFNFKEIWEFVSGPDRPLQGDRRLMRPGRAQHVPGEALPSALATAALRG